MEYLGGGEVKWRDSQNRPVLTVSQTRRILRDAVLGLEYRKHPIFLFLAVILIHFLHYCF